MSKRISLSKLAKKVEEKKEKATISSTKGVVINEKRPREEVLDFSPRKKGKTDDSKGKETMPPPEVVKTKPSRVVSKWSVAPREGTSARPGDALGSRASVMVSASVMEKILARVILPADKKKVEKFSLDQVATKFLHIVAQVFFPFHPKLLSLYFINSRRSQKLVSSRQ